MHRHKRIFEDSNKKADYRDGFQHDRDRIIHSTALRRLEEVSQVVNPLEGRAFHNRLTHTLKVAQIARRIAEKFLTQSSDNKNQQYLINQLGGLNAEVAEAAALAHDLGHPPFGHLGEETLDKLVREKGNIDGFEGNAQSFRIITKLETRTPDIAGLNLTKATLRAVLKYPWHHNENPNLKEKWGAYRTELRELEFAQILPNTILPSNRMSLEAAIMDLADDIAYATHDIEDFYRAGLIPLHLLYNDNIDDDNLTDEGKRFIEQVIEWWKTEKPSRIQDNTQNILNIFNKNISLHFYGITEPYRGTRSQNSLLRRVASIMIGNYVNNVKINHNIKDIHNDKLLLLGDNGDMLLEIKILKYMTRYYVHNNRALVTQQHGERLIIEDLFKFYFDAAMSIKSQTMWRHILPPDYLELFTEEEKRQNPRTHVEYEALHARLVADVISQMTDGEAHKMHSRLIGNGLGSIFDRL